MEALSWTLFLQICFILIIVLVGISTIIDSVKGKDKK